VTPKIILTPETAELLGELEPHRRELGLTQEQAAHLLGTSRRRMRRLEVEAPASPQAIRMALVYTGLRGLLGLPRTFDSNGSERREAA
jgi:DNA-binding XRE family transcriptional regulator